MHLGGSLIIVDHHNLHATSHQSRNPEASLCLTRHPSQYPTLLHNPFASRPCSLSLPLAYLAGGCIGSHFAGIEIIKQGEELVIGLRAFGGHWEGD